MEFDLIMIQIKLQKNINIFDRNNKFVLSILVYKSVSNNKFLDMSECK